jgi:SAM-dependent methyltransferase
MSHDRFVISGGKFIGKFEDLYLSAEDPWAQSSIHQIMSSRRMLAINWCNRLKVEYGSKTILDCGCGLGHMVNTLQNYGFDVEGIDISKSAILKAKLNYLNCKFKVSSIDNFSEVTRNSPDIFIFSEITWYILDQLDLFISRIKAYAHKKEKPIFLIHLLTTYEDGVQKYGTNKFKNLDEILKNFGMQYLESAFMKSPTATDPNSQGTFFVAKII